MPRSIAVRIATRGSKLARWQADWVAAQLRGQGVEVEIVEIATRGDAEQQGPVTGLGVQGVFTKEIQSAVLSGEADIAVHSLKDLPTQQTAGLALAAIPPRENPSDALVSRGDLSLDELPEGARVGTGSLRRRAQILHLRPDLQVLEIRGNVDTRIRKLDAGDFDAIILAAAGLVRLGWQGRIAELLEPPRMLPAPGQGALAIEGRADDAATLALFQAFDDRVTRLAVTAERSVLAALHGGCSAPVAAWGRIALGRLHLDGLVADLQGRQVLRARGDADVNALPDELGARVAADLLAQGAEEIVALARPQ